LSAMHGKSGFRREITGSDGTGWEKFWSDNTGLGHPFPLLV
jgi:hypothetical protein